MRRQWRYGPPPCLCRPATWIIDRRPPRALPRDEPERLRAFQRMISADLAACRLEAEREALRWLLADEALQRGLIA